LVAFKDDLSVDTDLERYVRRDLKAKEARAMFTELEFFALMKEMPQPAATPLAIDPLQVVDVQGLATLAAALEQARSVAVAPAFEGPAHSAVPLGLGLSLEPGGVFYVDVAACGAAAVASALSLEHKKLWAHDAKATLHLFQTLKLNPPKLDCDVELLSYLL